MESDYRMWLEAGAAAESLFWSTIGRQQDVSGFLPAPRAFWPARNDRLHNNRRCVPCDALPDRERRSDAVLASAVAIVLSSKHFLGMLEANLHGPHGAAKCFVR